MKWGRKKHSIKVQEDDDVNEPNAIKKPSSSSSPSSKFSLSNLLPLSAWLSKLKHPRPNSNHNPKPTTAPTPKPLFSPPPLARTCTRTHSDVAPHRLSVGDDDSHLARSRIRTYSLPRARAHHHSLGSASELDFLLLEPTRPRSNRPHRRLRRRCRATAADHLYLKPIKTGPDMDTIRSGRRSFSGGRMRPKVRVYSPRLANPNTIARERGALESFAVVKSTSDPVRDFRESMEEMFWERGIGRPEELESLLACYLSLNSDEHHDVIVKVFRQVWFDLNRQMTFL